MAAGWGRAGLARSLLWTAQSWGGSEISPSGSHLLSLPRPPQHAPHHNEAANRRGGLEGAASPTSAPPLSGCTQSGTCGGAAAKGTQWDTESRLRIKSSRLLITAGIPSGWLRSSAGLQNRPMARQLRVAVRAEPFPASTPGAVSTGTTGVPLGQAEQAGCPAQAFG